MIPWFMCCFLVACHVCFVLGRETTLHLLLSIVYNGQRQNDVVSDPVSQSFADAWAGDPITEAVIVTKVSSDNICTFTKTFGSSIQLKSTGLFITHPSFSTCANVQDSNNATLLISSFRLRADSHFVSPQAVAAVTIVKLVECCQVTCSMATLSEGFVPQNPLNLFAQYLTANSNGNNFGGQSPFGPGNNTLTFLSKNSIFFVAISFIVLMIISLGWLAFYYVERFRNAHTKEYISKRIAKAAKKALSKMPLKTVRGNGADDVNYQSEQCTVCIEHFRPADIIRQLPCKHLYHKVCIDPWLMQNHTCPVCKLDILTASGIELPYGRYNCDLDSVVVGRSLELYPVQLDLLMHAGESASPDSSNSMGGDQEIQLVHIRPPAVQVHLLHNHFRACSSSRRSSASSSSPSSRRHSSHYGKVDEEIDSTTHEHRASTPFKSCRSATSSNEDLSKLLGENNDQPAESSTICISSSKSNKSGEKETESKKHARSKRLKKSSNCSKNVACVVDVIAPATPPLDLVGAENTSSDPPSSTISEESAILDASSNSRNA